MAATADLVHKIRFNQLGRKHKKIADLLNIEPRAWRYLRNGQKNFSSALASRVQITLLVNRTALISLQSSPLSNAMSTSVMRATSLDDLKVNAGELDNLLKRKLDSQDYGLIGLSGAVCFAIWVLGSDFSKRALASLNYLNTAIERWAAAARIAPPGIPGKTFAINARTARIYKEVYVLSDEPVPKASIENYNAYREYAIMTNCVQAWRDVLEQAALLKDSVKINQDFIALLDYIQSSLISIEDLYEVVLPELRSIDNAFELERQPAFQAWIQDITQHYNTRKGIAA